MKGKNEKTLRKNVSNTKKITLKHGKEYTVYKSKQHLCHYSIVAERAGAEALSLVCNGVESAVMLIQTQCILIDDLPKVRSFGKYTFIDVKNDVALSFDVTCGI